MPRSWSLRVTLWFALKPASWPKIAVPALLGTAVGARAAGGLDPVAAIFAWAYTAFLLAGIVLLNDWADEDVDRLKRRMFPEAGAPKTIPDGILHRVTVFRLGTGAMLAAAGTCVWLSGLAGRPAPLLLGLLGIGLFAAYSLPPVRLNGRGGGELLEALGVGLSLPVFHALLQAPDLAARHLVVFAPYTLLSLASAVASGLADERSDRRGGKTTVATVFGNAAARRTTEVAWALGTVAYGVVPLLAGDLVGPVGAGAAAVASLVFGRRMLADSAAATREAWPALRAYKAHLHRAIWASGIVYALACWFA